MKFYFFIFELNFCVGPIYCLIILNIKEVKMPNRNQFHHSACYKPSWPSSWGLWEKWPRDLDDQHEENLEPTPVHTYVGLGVPISIPYFLALLARIQRSFKECIQVSIWFLQLHVIVILAVPKTFYLSVVHDPNDIW